jgi:hypothetical protein
MSKKTLLNEASVRKFMKFAKIDRYADNFINEMYAPMEEEEAMEEGVHADEKMEEGVHAEEEEGMEPMDDDMPAEEAPEMEDEGEDEAMEGTVDLEAFMDAFETALEAATGEDVEVDMGAEAEMGEEAPEMDDEVAGEMEMVDDEEVLEETVRRVTARLSKMVESKKKAANKARMVESITDRIVARILKGE